MGKLFIAFDSGVPAADKLIRKALFYGECLVVDCNQSVIDWYEKLFKGSLRLHTFKSTRGYAGVDEVYNHVFNELNKTQVVVLPLGEKSAPMFLEKYWRDDRVSSLYANLEWAKVTLDKKNFSEEFFEWAPKDMSKVAEGARFVKTATGSGSRFICITDGIVNFQNIYDKQGNPLGELVEEEILGEPFYSAEVLVNPQSGIMKYCLRQTLKEVGANDWITRTVFDVPELVDRVIRMFVAKAQSKFILSGINNVQLMTDSQGLPVIVEVNARFTGGSVICDKVGFPIVENLMLFLRGERGIIDRRDGTDVMMVRHFNEQYKEI